MKYEVFLLYQRWFFFFFFFFLALSETCFCSNYNILKYGKRLLLSLDCSVTINKSTFSPFVELRLTYKNLTDYFFHNRADSDSDYLVKRKHPIYTYEIGNIVCDRNNCLIFFLFPAYFSLAYQIVQCSIKDLNN